MKIGDLEITGKCALAPMAGYTDKAFRKLCIDYGASFAVSEMVSTKAIIYKDKKTRELMELEPLDYPQGIQLFGNNPEDFEKAVRAVLEFKPDFIDINMGCPVPKIVSQGSGSALMKNPRLCYEIVKAAKHSAGDIPVTVKIRKGFDEKNINACEVAAACEEAGCSAVFIHGRTKEQMYRGKADLDIIKAVKGAVSVPVIGNGDISSPEDVARMLEYTGCDIVLIGRGALGNPFIFRYSNIYMSRDTLPQQAGLSEILYTMLKHIKLLCEYKGEKRGMQEARKHIFCYIKGLKKSAYYRNEASQITTFSELERLAFEIQKANA